MSDPLLVVAIVLSALGGSIVAAVAGFGAATVLLPLMVATMGVREAVPVLTVVQLMGNLSRVFFNRRELDLPVVGWFAVGAVPASVFGAMLFATAPAPILRQLLGAFLVLAVVFRHTPVGRNARVGLRGFAPLGAFFGFVAALIGTTGPLAAPFFLSYGLRKGAYIATDAMAAVVIHTVKVAVYGQYDLMGPSTVAMGSAIGAVMILGSYLGKRILDRIPEWAFLALIEILLVVSGAQFLLSG